MKFTIESEGGRQHWIVKCIEKGRLIELHRFYRLGEFLYSRGEIGEHELAAREALLEHFRDHADTVPEIPDCVPVRKKAR